ncbi:transposase [Ktedonobacteria bacterium brp13]|nr:transposase [Ktedonobacteria bacterium brp13]
MKVQRVRLPETSHISWLVLDDDYVPIEPILHYLQFLDTLERSPYTIRSTAYHLKLFWEFLRDRHLEWKKIDVSSLASFITWLRQRDSSALSIDPQKAKRTNATIDQILTAVHGYYDFHVRLHTVPELPLYQFLIRPTRHYKPFLHGIAKNKPLQRRIVSTKREQRHVKTLTTDQVQKLLNACTHTRDLFLLKLLYDTGMRIGQALGLRHEDLNIEDGEIEIVPRNDNSNGARAKTRFSYTIPVLPDLMQLYTDYLVEDLGALEVPSLPDYVFVNLWEGKIGRPMTYETVRSLVRRLCKKTDIQFSPHMLRHTCATEWIRGKKVSLEEASRLLGHASIETTHNTYVHLTKEDLKKALEDAKGNDDGQ